MYVYFQTNLFISWFYNTNKSMHEAWNLTHKIIEHID